MLITPDVIFYPAAGTPRYAAQQVHKDFNAQIAANANGAKVVEQEPIHYQTIHSKFIAYDDHEHFKSSTKILVPDQQGALHTYLQDRDLLPDGTLTVTNSFDGVAGETKTYKVDMSTGKVID